MICPRQHCGGALVERTDAIGRIFFDCAACLRNTRGLCRDCPAPLPSPRWMRCEACAAAERRRKDLAVHQRALKNPAKRAHILKRRRARWNDPALHAQHIEHLHAYRAAHPRKRRRPDESDRAYWRALYRLDQQDAALVARKQARRRKYNARPEVRERRRQQQQRYRDKPGVRQRDAARQRERLMDPVFREQRNARQRELRALKKAGLHIVPKGRTGARPDPWYGGTHIEAEEAVA